MNDGKLLELVDGWQWQNAIDKTEKDNCAADLVLIFWALGGSLAESAVFFGTESACQARS
jgi:hypothetical protein